MALGDHVCCVLVTLDGCHHLDNLEQQWLYWSTQVKIVWFSWGDCERLLCSSSPELAKKQHLSESGLREASCDLETKPSSGGGNIAWLSPDRKMVILELASTWTYIGVREVTEPHGYILCHSSCVVSNSLILCFFLALINS